MKKPKISVLMPAYNAEKYIADSIQSIRNQTFKDFELIISDDASTDRTWEIIHKFKRKDKRIKIFRNNKNQYIAVNRNILVKHSKGKYIAWQDADDISINDRLQSQYDFMENNPGVGILGGFLQFFNEHGMTTVRRYAETDIELRNNIFKYSPVAQPTAMIRRKCFAKVGYYNPKYPPAEDIDMSFRIGAKYKFANLQKVTLKYREHNNSATFRKLRKIESATIEVRLKNNLMHGYKMTLIDYLYNLVQYISMFIVPPSLKIRLFNYFRNNKA